MEVIANGLSKRLPWGSRFSTRRNRIYRLTFGVGLFWFILVWCLEWLYPSRALSSCGWPGVPADARIALVADPQLVDDNTYPGRPSILLEITKFVADRYMATNWRLVNQALDPDAALFLGDLFDGGREWDDKMWNEEFLRWSRVFPSLPEGKRTIMSLPGNHDIGSGTTIIPHARDRFQSRFGPSSRVIEIGDYSLVQVDTIALASPGNLTNEVKQFLQNLVSWPLKPTRILLTHVPLFRYPKTDCGPERERPGSLPYVRGYQYETLVPPDLTEDLLALIRPQLVFSGDDHDACHVEHFIPGSSGSLQNKANEYTVKTFSLANGISRPGLQLLSLGDDGIARTSLCLLGRPFLPLKIYAVAALVNTVCIIVFLCPRRKAFYLPVQENDEAKRQNWRPRTRGIESLTIVLGAVAGFLVSQMIVTRMAYAPM